MYAQERIYEIGRVTERHRERKIKREKEYTVSIRTTRTTARRVVLFEDA